MSCKVALPVIEDFSHFEGVSPLPFPESYPSWPATEQLKSENVIPGLEHGHESMEPPVLLSFASVKEPPVLLSFGSGKEPPAFLSFMSGKDSEMRDFSADISASISNFSSSSFSALPVPPTLSVASFHQKPSITGSQFTAENLLNVTKFGKEKLSPVKVKQEPKEDTSDKSSVESIAISNSSSTASSSDIVTASSPDSSSPLSSLLAVLDGDRKVLPERKAKSERKPVKREREEKKQSLFKRGGGRKKRNSDDSDAGSEFDSNDSGCWAESKKERNKKAASNYRKRRKMYVSELEAKVAHLSEKSSKDRACVATMTDEVQILKERIECLEQLLTQHNVEFPKKKVSGVNKKKSKI